MSITNIAYPANNLTVQDSLWHIAASSNSGSTDMKYIFDLFNGNNQLIRVKVFPDPTNGRGYFDAGPIIRNEITYDWFVPENNTAGENVWLYEPSVNGQVAVTYNYRIGEDVSGVATLNMASGNVTAYNYSAPLFKRFVDNVTSMDNKFFTNRPRTIKAQFGQKILIPYKVENIRDITIYVTIGATTYSGGTKEFQNAWQLDIGTAAINSYLGANHITSSTKEYLVKVYDDLDAQYTETITVKLDCQPKYENVNLYFINQWGMFDTAAFSLASRLTMDTERKAYQQKEYSLNNSSVTYYNSDGVYNESKINYGSKTNWTYKLTMDFPTDAEYEWLAELMVSPQVYAEIDGYYYPVTIKATNYEYSKHTNNGLRPLEVEIEMNQTRYGFRR